MPSAIRADPGPPSSAPPALTNLRKMIFCQHRRATKSPSPDSCSPLSRGFVLRRLSDAGPPAPCTRSNARAKPASETLTVTGRSADECRCLKPGPKRLASFTRSHRTDRSRWRRLCRGVSSPSVRQSPVWYFANVGGRLPSRRAPSGGPALHLTDTRRAPSFECPAGTGAQSRSAHVPEAIAPSVPHRRRRCAPSFRSAGLARSGVQMPAPVPVRLVAAGAAIAATVCELDLGSTPRTTRRPSRPLRNVPRPRSRAMRRCGAQRRGRRSRRHEQRGHLPLRAKGAPSAPPRKNGRGGNSRSAGRGALVSHVPVKNEDVIVQTARRTERFGRSRLHRAGGGARNDG
jgi:hypothetical protein